MVIQRKKPLLGVCLGMQLLGISSDEQGRNAGLGFVKGVVTRFNDKSVKVPHIGFNQIEINPRSRLYLGMQGTPDFYFVHSFKMQCDNDIHQSICHYDDKFIASFEQENIVGVQFHPELSQKNGLKVIQNFIEKF